LRDENDTKINQYDVIDICDRKYLVVKIGKKSAEIFPIDDFLNGIDEYRGVLKMCVNKDVIKMSVKSDEEEILCLINENNPIIRQALHELFYEGK
jgi:hypothetical protein